MAPDRKLLALAGVCTFIGFHVFSRRRSSQGILASLAMDEAVVDHTLSSAERAQFEADGFLVLPEVLSHNDVASLSDAMDEWSDSMGGVAAGSTWHGMIFDKRHDTPFWHAALVRMLYHPKVFGKVVGILGWNIYCYHAHAMFTRAVSGSPGSMLMEPLGDHWHQDSGRVNEDVTSPE